MESDARRRYVLDTNTLVSAFLFAGSVPARVLEYVLGGHTLLMSLELAAELAEVFRRDRFDRYLSLARREELVAGAIRQSKFIVTSTRIVVCRDDKDNQVLELAVDGNATAIITGDSDLLALHPFQDILIVRPREFLDRVRL
jgi:uncharacterized protein